MKIKLVFSGSGLLYPVHAGAAIRLAEAGYEFEEVCGVSGGAIIAAALASGYKPNTELIKLIKQTLPAKNGLIDISIIALFSQWGLIKGDKIEKMLEKYMAKTFADVKIPLKIVTTDVSRQEQYIFSSETHKDMQISKAVRASMSIPLIFAPTEIAGEIYVDGGWVKNFPIDIYGNSDNVVGLRFASNYKQYVRTDSVKSYLMNLINTSIESNMEDDLRDASKANVIILKTKHNSLNFNVVDKDVDEMIADGWNAADAAIKMGKLPK